MATVSITSACCSAFGTAAGETAIPTSNCDEVRVDAPGDKDSENRCRVG
jgi:hypothetical protein